MLPKRPKRPPALALTTSWKTITLCFDRDLYPLSLPGNLSNAQREAIASNILKIQFQFNQAKDWTVTSYPSNGKYTDIPKTTAFDFWLDDLQFITGDCPNNTTFTSTSSSAKKFPQNKGIGSCAIASNAAKFNAAITTAYARWKTNFVKSDGSIVSPEQNGVITSEAMGYGMMIAAAMGDKDTFDKFWTYAKAHLSGGLMTWSNSGSGSATDGDTDIAYGLFMADAQWGGYTTDASAMASAILSSDVATGNVLKGGSQWMDRFNPSYFSPLALRKFGGFAAVITKGYQLVNANIAAATAGLPTDWADPSSGAPSDKGSAQVTSELAGIAYGYDAARVPWRVGMDVCGGATEGSSSINSIISFFSTKYDAGATIDLLKAGWTKSSGVVDSAAKDMQGSFIGPMGVAGMAANNATLRDRSFRTILDILDYGDFNHTYFPSTVGLITLLVMSGNFPTP
jgi:endo-1,4-beta-D-glucanase Y